MVKTGIARRDITPQESVPLLGYGDRTHDSTGIHDPLSVYAWWIESEGEAPADTPHDEWEEEFLKLKPAGELIPINSITN